MPPAADETGSAPRNLGVILVIAGLVVLFWPAATIRIIASLAGVGAVAYGMTELSRVYAGRGDHLEFSAGMIGLVSVFGGIVIAITPYVNEAVTATVIGVYWLLGGVVELAGGFLRPVARLERLLVGALSVTAGVLVLALPSTSLVVLVWLSGAWMLTAGAIVILMRSITRPRRAVA